MLPSARLGPGDLFQTRQVRQCIHIDRKPASRFSSYECRRNSALVSAHSAVQGLGSVKNDCAVSVENLSHTYGAQQVLRNVYFKVPRGTLHILAGANGCGKSTLLRILGGLLPRESGIVYVDQPIGTVLQNPDHQIVMPTVAADVAFGLGRYKLDKATVRSLVREALATVGLESFADRPTNTLSGGEKQRVAIAGALVQNPKVLLLDELTTFLDYAGQRAVIDAVRAAVDGPRKVTAVWVTHRLEELEWADGASFMDEGKIKVTGRPSEVVSHLKQLGATIA